MINVAILGAGFMGRTHAASYATLGSQVRVNIVCDSVAERGVRLGDAIGAEVSTDLGRVVCDPRVDVVDICLPTPLHRLAAEQAFAAGKHVFLEKPIALSLKDADAIVNAAATSGRHLMVGHVLRFWPEYVAATRCVTSGALGEPLSVSTQRLLALPDWNDWMRDRAQSGGVPVDVLLHDFDLMSGLLGCPRSVFATAVGTSAAEGSDVFTQAHVFALVECEHGEGLAEGGMVMPTTYPFSSSLRVVCERGILEYAFHAPQASGGGNIGSVERSPVRLYRPGGEAEKLLVEIADPWTSELSYFLECIEHDRAPEQGNADQARDALRVALAVNRSIASRRRERVFPDRKTTSSPTTSKPITAENGGM